MVYKLKYLTRLHDTNVNIFQMLVKQTIISWHIKSLNAFSSCIFIFKHQLCWHFRITFTGKAAGKFIPAFNSLKFAIFQ